MLEHLGLGITLQMEDNFTPQANTALNSFERLSAGAQSMEQKMQQSMNNLQNLMLSGFSLDMIGESFQQAGDKILGIFEKFGSNFVKVNADYQTLQAQLLTSFKGNAEESVKAFDWVRQFSAQTPFETKGLTDAFAKMKSTNMDLRQEFKLTNGEVKSFAEAMGDLATRNMGANGGMEGMGIAIQNAWSGQVKSLYDRFNLAKSDLDGMMKYAGKDANKFMEEFVKLSQNYAPDAMKNMGGTWAQTMSNMEDMWNNFQYDLGKTGVFNEVNDSLNKLQEKLSSVFSDPDKVKVFGQILGDLWRPIRAVVTGVGDLLVNVLNFATAHPVLARLGAEFLAINGVVLVLTGTLMKMFGGALILVTSLVSAWANLKVIGTFGGISEGLGGISLGLTGILSSLALGAVAVGVFALAWKDNFMGIRDSVDRLKDKFKNVMSLSELFLGSKRSVRDRLDMDKEMNFDRTLRATEQLALKVAQVKVLGQGLKEVLFGQKDGRGDTIFSDYLKTVADNTGMMSALDSIDRLRKGFSAFFDGFRKGIEVSVGMVKQFIDLVSLPIKAVAEAFPKLKLPVVNASDLGNWQMIGKLVGGLAGSMLGFKLVSKLTSAISSPFRALFNNLTKTKNEIKDVGRTMEATTASIGKKSFMSSIGTKVLGNNAIGNYAQRVLGGVAGYEGASLMQRILGKSPETGQYRWDRAKDHYNSYDRSATNTEGNQNYGRFKRVYSNQIDESYMKHKLGMDGIDTNNLYTNRAPSFWKKAFGENYYTQDKSGNMSKVGSFGGFFSAGAHDKQLQYAGQRSEARGIGIDRGNILDHVGDAGALKNMRAHIPKMDSVVGDLASVRDKWGGFDDSALKSREEYIRKNAYKMSGVDGRKFNNPYEKYTELPVYEKMMNTETGKWETVQKKMFGQNVTQRGINPLWQAKEDSRNSLVNGLIDKDPIVQHWRKQQELSKVSGDQAIYRKNRSGLSRALLGDKFYKLDTDENGKMYENTVMRRGGLLRRSKNDMVYNEEGKGGYVGNLARRAGTGIAQSKVGQGFSNMTTGIKEKFTNIGAGLQSRFTGLGTAIASSTAMMKVRGAGSRIAGMAGRVGSGAMGFINNQRARLGMGAMTSIMPAGVRNFMGGSFGAKAGMIGRGAMSFGGRAVGMARGAVGAVGRGVGMVGRGLGAVGGLAMRAMPLAMLGGMAFSKLKEKGEGSAMNGLKAYQAELKKVDFNAMFSKLKTGGKEAWNIIKDMAITVWTKLKPELPGILKSAWEGIKAMAKIAWEWMKTDGVTLMGQAWDVIKDLAGKFWNWLCTDGVKILGDLAKSAMTLLGKAFEWLGDNAGKIAKTVADWVVGTGIPLLINGIVSLGGFIIEHIPQAVGAAVNLAWGLMQGLWELVKGLFVGLGTFLGDAFKGAVSGLKEMLPKLIAIPIRAIPIIGDQVADALGLPSFAIGSRFLPKDMIIQAHEGEMIVPKSENPYANSGGKIMPTANSISSTISSDRSSSQSSANVDNSIRIDKVEIVVQADRMSRADAREQAKMVLEELNKMKNEKMLRQYA